MNSKTMFRIAAIAMIGMAISGPQATAETWPQRTVKFILPLGAGSGADIGARLVAEKLSARWGQPVVVENRPGGDGIVAINAFVGAHDDHVLFLGPSSSFIAHPYMYPKLSYDPHDLAPVARISSTIIAISVPTSLGVNSLKELFALARQKPGTLNWVSITGATDFILRSFMKKSGLEMARVPYRNPVEALTDTAKGRMHLYWAAYAIVQGQAQAGLVKVIAIANSHPTPLVPGVPTAAQAGYPDLTFDGLVGIFGPRDMPASVRDRIANDVKAALADPTVHSRLETTGQIVIPGTSADLAQSIETQRNGLKEVTAVLGLKPATQ